MAFFSLDFFSCGRASDLGRIKTIDILKHPDGSSLLFHQRVGKTLRGNFKEHFQLNKRLIPLFALLGIRSFSSTCVRLWTSTFLLAFFSALTSKKGGILNATLLASTVQARLIKYLSSLGIDENESVHGFRTACPNKKWRSTLAGNLLPWPAIIHKFRKLWTRPLFQMP